MDKCKECIRYKEFQREKCINCGSISVKLTLEGFSLVGKCMKCDNSFVGVSFYAPCEIDSTEYVLKITEEKLSNEQIVFLRNLLHISVMDLKQILQNKEYFSVKFRLKEIVEILKELDRANIKYIVEPELEYSRLFLCERKLI